MGWWKTMRPLPIAGMELVDRYEALPKVPLRVRAILDTPYLPTEAYGGVHLDGILGWAVLQTYLRGRVDSAHQGMVLPLPLEALWISTDGLPLWAAGDLLPEGAALPSKEYQHKRYPAHRMELSQKGSVSLVAGRWKESRIPLATVRTEAVQAFALGNPEEVRSLLASISHLGRRTAAGYGRVAAWEVEPLPHSREIYLSGILLERPVPLGFFSIYGIPVPSGRRSPNKCWTPPYWWSPWAAPCLVPQQRPETTSLPRWIARFPPSEIDFYAAVEALNEEDV